jgi:hypothetical protein
MWLRIAGAWPPRETCGMESRRFRGCPIRRAAIVALAVAAVFAPAVATHADDNLRCGSRLVSLGDGKDKVRALCGEPSDVAFVGTIGRRSFPTYPGSPNYGTYDYGYYGPAWVELPVEVWTYNFGSHKLLRKLRFVGDDLAEIRTDGYGY